MRTTGMTSLLRHLVILIVFGGFARPAQSESVVPSFTTMSHKSYSNPLSYYVTPSSSSQPSGAGDSGTTNRLDFISVAVICGVVAFCFIICLIVGCRRRKPRHHLPRCEDMTPTVISPSLTGICISYVIKRNYDYIVMAPSTVLIVHDQRHSSNDLTA